MTDNITFADLEKLLLKLGFVLSRTKGSHKLFKHSTLGTLIALPTYSKQEAIHPTHLVSVRKILIENGLITSAAFDGFLEKINR